MIETGSRIALSHAIVELIDNTSMRENQKSRGLKNGEPFSNDRMIEVTIRA